LARWSGYDVDDLASLNMTKSDRAAAALREAWSRVDSARAKAGKARLSRKELAGIYLVTPGMVSHYMRGREPLNIEWQLRFAQYLGLPVAEIWPDFPHKNIISGLMSPETVELARAIQSLDETEQNAVRLLIHSLAKKSERAA
jgi:hypothetical protein